MITKMDFVKNEKYLKLNENGDFIIDYDKKLNIIDFHTHMSNVIFAKYIDPNTKGSEIKYLTLPSIDKMDLSVPYWTKINQNEKKKGLMPIIKFSVNGYNILKDMVNGGTYDNCFKSQDENMIMKNIVLPLSSKKCDRSMEALRLVKDYPDKFMAFCSVHPHDPQFKEKIKKYKKLGAKGFKLKITDMELKGDFSALVDLFRACYESELPVLLHTGSITNYKRQNISKMMWKLLHSTRVELFGELLRKLPNDFIFIFGHSGVAEYKLVAKYLKKHPACYAELSCQSETSIKYLMNEVGYKRLLYGSDWPALPQAITLSRVLIATEGNEVARDHILYNNAARLLKLTN